MYTRVTGSMNVDIIKYDLLHIGPVIVYRVCHESGNLGIQVAPTRDAVGLYSHTHTQLSRVTLAIGLGLSLSGDKGKGSFAPD